MEVKIRKAEGAWHQHRFEWQAPNSETWYLISRHDICVYDGLTGLRHNENVGKFFNALLRGETITAFGCRYFRKLRLLLIEYGGGKAGKIEHGSAETPKVLHNYCALEHGPEARRPAPQLPNLDGGENMGKKKQKEKTGYDPKAIREAAETLTGKQEKPKTKQPKEKPAAKQPEKPKAEKPKAPSDSEVLEALKQLGKAGSREISDKLDIEDPEKGRAYVRNVMKRLAEAGKVKVVKEGKQYRYEAA
jgi:hypothetical protein